jgi:iron complex transport system permease protein
VTEVKHVYEAARRRKVTFLAILSVALVIVSIVALGTGSVLIPVPDVLQAIGNALLPGWFGPPSYPNASTIVISLRAPRIALAILAGMSLAIAGTVMQGVLRNPLVSPFTLGLSSAAAFGAALIMAFGPLVLGSAYYGTTVLLGQTFTSSSLYMILFAFLFGMSTVLLVYILARSQKLSGSIMILSGVVIGYLFQAGITFLKYISDDSALREITTWLMGGMWGATWGTVAALIPVVLICMYLMERCSLDLNTFTSGDEVARSLGINVPRMRLYCLLVVSFAASACIAFTGVIGFIGLMAPHICRMFIGNDHKYLIPCSALMGALILLISDTVARIIISPVELPVGVIMYAVGGVFFLYLITLGRGRNFE